MYSSVLFPGGGASLKPNGSGFIDTAMRIYDYFVEVRNAHATLENIMSKYVVRVVTFMTRNSDLCI